MVGHNGDKMSRTRLIVILCMIAVWLILPKAATYASANVTGSFEVVHSAPTVTSFVPADDATGVVPDANLVLNFSETVVKGSGNIVIYKSDNTPFETINVTDARVSISGSQVTVNPDGIFASETAYYVQIADTSFEDTEGTPYAGINDATTWNFTSIYIGSKVQEVVTGVQTNYTVNATATASTMVTVNTTATVTITILKYAANSHPEIELPANILPDHFIDVMVDIPSAIVWPVYVEQSYTDADAAGIVESSLRMYYYSAGSWNQCSDTGVNTANNTVWARMTESEFTGSPLIIGGTAVTPAGGGEEEEEEWTPPSPAPKEEEEEWTPPSEPAPEEEEEEVTPPSEPAPEEEEEEVTPPSEPAPEEEEEEVTKTRTEPFNLPLIGGLIGAVVLIVLLFFLPLGKGGRIIR